MDGVCPFPDISDRYKIGHMVLIQPCLHVQEHKSTKSTSELQKEEKRGQSDVILLVSESQQAA